MSISELLRQIRIDPREAELLLAHVIKKDRSYVKAHAQDKVDAKSAKKFLNLAGRRQKNEPIAYLIGSQPFFGRDFIVNKDTLIPRPETERLVELVNQHGAKNSVSIVDVGTGSGCIAITLALEVPHARIIASDASNQALKVARQNAKHFKAKVDFVKDDLLGKKLKTKLKTNNAIFVANLPYLPKSDKKTMMPDVAKYEPAKALFADSDGLSLVIRLLKQIKILNVKCSMFFEIDPRQTKKLTIVARQLFPKHKVLIKKDQFGRERFLVVI
jgi:release factor glutamine methyltransferase